MDDLLAATLLVTRAPVLMAPAMHTEMWTHPATAANVATLRERGVTVVPPAVGRLTGADSGPGRLPDPEHLAQLAELLLTDTDRPALPFDLAGRRIVVSAGGTREALDPVRFLGNRSSGRQGYAIALVAAARGAEVTLVAANTALADPPGVTVRSVGSAAELQTAMQKAVAGGVDAVVMNAAVADFRRRIAPSTRSRSPPMPDRRPSNCWRTRTILAGLVADRGDAGSPVIAGFAAETGDGTTSPLEFGRQKLARKGCDLLVVNRVDGGRGFESDDNAAVILHATGESVEVPFGPKAVIAAAVCDALSGALAAAPRSAADNLSQPKTHVRDSETHQGVTT